MPSAGFICFDLEGPLSPQDNAYELMKLSPSGGKAFETLSRYDDLLALEGRAGYEPGDTLSLIVPFLVYFDIPESAIIDLSQRASLVDGAAELMGKLRQEGWQVFCISTSYEQYALRIAKRVGIEESKVACTRFPLDRYRAQLGKEDFKKVQRVEKDILATPWGEDEGEMKARLDRFFWQELMGTALGNALSEVKPVGGQRKVAALLRFAEAYQCPLNKAIAVGDSITDWRMLQTIRDAGGLSVAFNANEYALPHATIGLASTCLADLYPVLEMWLEDGLEATQRAVREKEAAVGQGNRNNFHWLLHRSDIKEPLVTHKRLRRIVREEAGKLG